MGDVTLSIFCLQFLVCISTCPTYKPKTTQITHQLYVSLYRPTGTTTVTVTDLTTGNLTAVPTWDTHDSCKWCAKSSYLHYRPRSPEGRPHWAFLSERSQWTEGQRHKCSHLSNVRHHSRHAVTHWLQHATHTHTLHPMSQRSWEGQRKKDERRQTERGTKRRARWRRRTEALRWQQLPHDPPSSAWPSDSASNSFTVHTPFSFPSWRSELQCWKPL